MHSIETDDGENLKIINAVDSDVLSTLSEISKIESVISILNPVYFESVYERDDIEFEKIGFVLFNLQFINQFYEVI